MISIPGMPAGIISPMMSHSVVIVVLLALQITVLFKS